MSDKNKPPKQLLEELQQLRKEKQHLQKLLEGKFNAHAFNTNEVEQLSIGDTTDNIQLHQTEQENEKRKKYLESVLKAVPDAVVILDTNKKIEYWNRGAEQLFGYSRKEALGKDIDKLVTKSKMKGGIDKFLNHLLGDQKSSPMETVRYHKDGTPVDVIEVVAPILVDEKTDSLVVVYTDISARKQVEYSLTATQDRYKSLFETSPLGIVTLNLKGFVTSANQAYLNMTGYEEEDMVGKHFTKVPTIQIYAKEFMPIFAQIIKGAFSQGIEFNWVHKSGEPRLGKVYIALLRKDSKVIGFQAIGEDITERVKASEALRESEEKFRTIVTQAQPVIFMIDREGTFTLSEGQSLARLGLKPGQVVGDSAFEIYKDYPDIIEGINRALQGEIYRQVVQVDDLFFDTSFSPLKDHSGEVTSVIGMSVDITDRIKANQHMEFLATHDALTQIPNRLLFQDRLEQAIMRADRNQTKLAVMFIDLDGFKPINDALGHAAGDSTLQEISNRLIESIRAVDTVARMGGDEFLVLIETLTDPGDTARIAEKILATISQPLYLADHEIFVTASIGISVYPDDSQKPDMLIQHANTAMRKAKMFGQNSCVYFSAELLCLFFRGNAR